MYVRWGHWQIFCIKEWMNCKNKKIYENNSSLQDLQNFAENVIRQIS